ncbi:MAG: acyltransferase [Cyanobacteria bacterium SIG28]|nr:acyltransferase [Cyanobacteria bacterium SIG28]
MFKNNKIYKIDKNGNKTRIFFVPGLTIRFYGKNNVVNIGYPYPKFNFCKIKCGNNCNISIGSSKNRVKNLKIFANANNAECKIGENFQCTNGCDITIRHEDNLKVTIGDNCLFGKNVEIRASDAHTIYNIKTNEPINYGKNISIGSHCWFGHNVSVMKGTILPDNCVVALGSILTSEYSEANSIYAGCPAKLIKTDINWRKEPPKISGIIN